MDSGSDAPAGLGVSVVTPSHPSLGPAHENVLSGGAGRGGWLRLPVFHGAPLASGGADMEGHHRKVLKTPKARAQSAPAISFGAQDQGAEEGLGPARWGQASLYAALSCAGGLGQVG